MLLFRVYIAVLTLLFLVLSLFERGVQLLEGTVIICALLFLILDIRKDIDDIKQLEREIDSLIDGI
jgi:hypothetical protein